MLQQSRPSDPPQEEAFIGDPRVATDDPAREHGSPPSSTREAAPAGRVRDRGKMIGLGAMGGLVVLGIGLMIASPRRDASEPLPALAFTTAGSASAGGDTAKEANAAVADAGLPVVRPPPAWRVSSLASDANVEVAEGSFGKRGLVATLTQAGLPRTEIRRLAQAFEGIRRIDRPRESDTFVLAKDKSKGTVAAFEYATSPFDVWQAKVDEAGAEGRIVVKKLDLFVERRRVAHGLVVSADLTKAITGAGLRPEIALAVDDALEGHIEPGSIRSGVRMRIAASEEWVEGAFVRVKVEAIEFVPKTGSPLRVYYYERDPRETPGSARRAPAAGFYDAKGRQPFHGQFRSPLALARVTSRFNPKRLHPVLKTVMPHQGVDFGASTGTPVYASAAGTVIAAHNSGPCGNMVEIDLLPPQGVRRGASQWPEGRAAAARRLRRPDRSRDRAAPSLRGEEERRFHRPARAQDGRRPRPPARGSRSIRPQAWRSRRRHRRRRAAVGGGRPGRERRQGPPRRLRSAKPPRRARRPGTRATTRQAKPPRRARMSDA